MALETIFKDLSNGHEFSIDQASGLATTSKTSCPEFSVATVSRWSHVYLPLFIRLMIRLFYAKTALSYESVCYLFKWTEDKVKWRKNGEKEKYF